MKMKILLHVMVSTTVVNYGFWIWSRFIWILTVTTTVIHFTNLQHINQRIVFWFGITSILTVLASSLIISSLAVFLLVTVLALLALLSVLDPICLASS
jgi:hypothetical protein